MYGEAWGACGRRGIGRVTGCVRVWWCREAGLEVCKGVTRLVLGLGVCVCVCVFS